MVNTVGLDASRKICSIYYRIEHNLHSCKKYTNCILTLGVTYLYESNHVTRIQHVQQLARADLVTNL